jgi:hypothetical protein
LGENEDEADGDSPRDTEPPIENIALGSKQRLISFHQLEEENSADLAFQRFRIKLANFLTSFLPTYGHKLPNGKPITLRSDDEVRGLVYSMHSSALTKDSRLRRTDL